MSRLNSNPTTEACQALIAAYRADYAVGTRARADVDAGIGLVDLLLDNFPGIRTPDDARIMLEAIGERVMSAIEYMAYQAASEAEWLLAIAARGAYR